MRHAELLGQHDADLPEALIVGLQPGEHEIELLVADRGGDRLGDRDCVGDASASDSTWIARSAPRASASRITCAARAGPAEHDHHFAGVLLLQPQRFLERVGVRLVQLEAGVLIANPGLRVVDAKLPLPGDDLFDADGDFHWLAVCQLPASSFAATSTLTRVRPACTASLETRARDLPDAESAGAGADAIHRTA